ncbi:MAG: GntR family transcriptional regulator [Proteobacteria bacterium]|nr:MAG: GntR family transcriptional regulator [Pseudomonadota bacterium]
MARKPIQKLNVVNADDASAGVETTSFVDELRRRIVNNELPPGSRLRESQLSSEFNVSRARIRDAFGILEERGLIERIPNKGAVVMRLEADGILELFDVREVTEGLVVRLATQRATPDTWSGLLEVFGAELEKKLADNDFAAYTKAIALFRRTCIDAAGNDTLRDLLDSIFDRVQVMTRRLVLVPGRAMEGLRQHKEILRAMRDGEAERAEELKRENIRSARQWFLKYQDFLL